MVRVLPILFLILLCRIAIAQDSVQVKQITAHHLSDSLSSVTHAKHQLDSLSPAVTHYRHSLDSSKRSLTHKIDSLEHLRLPATKYKHQLDSISRIDPLKTVWQQEARVTAAEQKINSTITGTEKKITQKLSSITSGAEGSMPPGAIPGTSLPNVNLPNANLPTIPNVNLPNASLPTGSLPAASLPSLNNSLTQDPLTKDLSSATALPQKEISELKNAGPLGEVKTELGNAGKITKQAESYGKDVKGVLHGDSASMQRLSKKAEALAEKNATGLKSLGSQTQSLDQYKKLAGSAENPEALEKQAMDQARKQAVNHFAGKEKELQGAMNEVTKLKAKYSTYHGFGSPLNRKQSSLKGQPLIERLVPGFNWQIISKGHFISVDFNPFIGYRLNKKLTVGAGWNQRVNFHHLHANTHPKYFGPRTFADYKIKGITLRLEFELMNTLIPPNQIFVFGDRPRQWVWNSFGGIKKNYRLFKHLNGNAQILYNLNSLFDKHHINLYGEPISARVGFEFGMTKRARKQ